MDDVGELPRQNGKGRVVPSDLAMERALLGAALLEPDAASVVASLPPGVWWGGPTQRIARVITELEQRGEPVDVHVVAGRLDADGELEAVGGHRGIIAIQSECGSTGPRATQHYAKLLLDKYRLRSVISATAAAQEAAYQQDLDLAVSCVAAVIDDLPEDDVAGDLGALLPKYLDLLIAREAGETGAISTGMFDLDGIIGGLHGGNLVVVGARTGAGKTATLCQFTLNLARAGRRVLFVSLEMPWPELLDRWVGNIARINTRHLRRGDIANSWSNVTAALDQAAKLGVRVAKPTTMTVPAIRAEARQHKADVVIVDYVQLVRAVNRRNTNRENDVGEISRSLKGMALALGVPVIAAAQLNRNPEMRHDRLPELSDLRDSGQIEQDSDVVVMVYRKSLHDKDADPSEIDLIVRKNRHGELNTAHMTFLGPFQAVVDRFPESRTRSTA